MKYTDVKSPQWVDASRTMIRATVFFEHVGPLKFIASPKDVEDHGRQIYADLIAGKYGDIAEPSQ